MAECHAGLADHAQVAATAEVLVRVGYDPAIDAYYAASYLCHCVRLVDKDTELDEAKRAELAKSHADRGMEMLRQAVDLGYKDAAHMKKDPHLEPLRARKVFKKLLADLEGKPKK